MKNFISENLVYLVNKIRVSQDEFGRMFDLSRGLVNQYVKDKSQPKIDTIQKICAHFDITIDDFINRKLEDIKPGAINEPLTKYEKEEPSTLRERVSLSERRLDDVEKFMELVRLKFQLDLDIEKGELELKKEATLEKGFKK